MKAIFVMFDSLNRHMLPPYGGKIIAPNFERLARRTVTFDTSYVCSMPCMPARRDLLTGRPNFLHRAWGPLEPYDEVFPSLLQKANIYSHLITDHQHYWEEGGANYHTKFTSFELIRGQEGDPWIPHVKKPVMPDTVAPRRDMMGIQDQANRRVMTHAHQQPMSVVFSQAKKFLDENHSEDNWFLQVETFDPHEPFFSHRKYKDLYAEHYHNYKGKPFDWPPYRKVQESPEEVEHLRTEYAALVSMCDDKLGDILDCMDEHDMWEDTMLIVGTDHGFLLGEHDSWAKCWMPFYEEIARTPFFVWDPRCAKSAERRQALVQPSIDFAPTLLRFFGLNPGTHMLGKDLAETIASDKPVRDTAIFGMFGCHINITDGRYVYMRGNPPKNNNEPLWEYTLMPSNMKKAFPISRFNRPLNMRTFNFTNGCHLMQVACASATMPGGEGDMRRFETLLFDLNADPQQLDPILDDVIEKKFCLGLDSHLRHADAPPEQWQRLGLA